jgi:hypothetical protein
MRHYATPDQYRYVTLGGTELKDVESLFFVDCRLITHASSFECKRDRHRIAEQSATDLAARKVTVETIHGNLFDYRRESDVPHIFFVDLEGVCAWADYFQRFGAMFQDAIIREGDAVFITSHLGHNPGWPRVFSTFDGQFRLLGITGTEEKKLWYRRAHPSFTLYKALEYASCVSELRLKAFGCIEYRDTSPMAVYGYAVAKGRTTFRGLILDDDCPYFCIKRGFLRSA